MTSLGLMLIAERASRTSRACACWPMVRTRRRRGNATAIWHPATRRQGVLKDETAAYASTGRRRTTGPPQAWHNLALLYDEVSADRRDRARRSLCCRHRSLTSSHSRRCRASPLVADFRRAFQRAARRRAFMGAIDGSFGHSTLSALNDYINRKKK
jgi:hypothetical protein